MRLVIAIVTMSLASNAGSVKAETSSLDAPLLDQTSERVNEKIFSQQKNSVLTDAQAARLQLRRQSIMQEAADRRKRNKGILPTEDLSRLVRRMDVLEKQVSRIQ